jgi:hypothetical protein
MVQRYPSSGKSLEPQRPAAPGSVLKAVRLMYAGAAISTVSLVISLADVGAIKPAIRRAFPHYTATQVNQYFTAFLIGAIASTVIAVGLWLWMAWANNQGKSWARITSAVLFGLWTLYLLFFLRGPKTPLILVFPVLTWFIGAATVWLLWRPDSNAFFR